jgi:hypothetical protein
MKKTELQKRYKRNKTKTTEGEFLYALRTSYEFSPKVCESILHTAKAHLLRDKLLKEGQIEITVIGIEERSGKIVEQMEKTRVILTIEKYLKIYQKETGEILPLKGYVLDQGSLPTHKGIIISLYEQGVSPADIVLRTSHSIDAVDRYIKHYEQVKKLIKRGMDEKAIKSITGRSLNVIRQYINLYYDFNKNSHN